MHLCICLTKKQSLLFLKSHQLAQKGWFKPNMPTCTRDTYGARSAVTCKENACTQSCTSGFTVTHTQRMVRWQRCRLSNDQVSVKSLTMFRIWGEEFNWHVTFGVASHIKCIKYDLLTIAQVETERAARKHSKDKTIKNVWHDLCEDLVKSSKFE